MTPRKKLMPKPILLQPPDKFEIRKRFFINTLKSEKGNYRISDSKSLNLFNSNIDVILSILSLNYKCVCTNDIFKTTETTFKYETEDKYRFFVVYSKTIKCVEIDIHLIRQLVNILLSVASSYKKFFAPYISKLSKISMDLDINCFTFAHLSKSFISLLKFYLDDVNYIDELFVKRVMQNIYLCEYHFFFITLCKKSTFIRILSSYNLVDLFLKMYEEGKTRVLLVLTDMLEIYQQKDPVFQKTNFDIKRMINDLTNREEYFLDIFLKTDDIAELNKIFDFICALLSIKTSHYLFVSAYCVAIDEGRILDFNDEKKVDNIQTLYLIRILSIILPHNLTGLFMQLENKDIIYHITHFFFKKEDLTFLHQTVLEIVKYILNTDVEKNFRTINIVLSVLEPQLIKWGREFFARENEKEWNMTSLNAFTIEFYKEMLELRKKCMNEYKNIHCDINKQLVDRIDTFMETDEFLFVKWYYERNVRSECLDLTNENDFDLYFEDCISEAHIRYIYYMVIEHLPYNKLFES